jgi:hypothetical protein
MLSDVVRIRDTTGAPWLAIPVFTDVESRAASAVPGRAALAENPSQVDVKQCVGYQEQRDHLARRHAVLDAWPRQLDDIAAIAPAAHRCEARDMPIACSRRRGRRCYAAWR